MRRRDWLFGGALVIGLVINIVCTELKLHYDIIAWDRKCGR